MRDGICCSCCAACRTGGVLQPGSNHPSHHANCSLPLPLLLLLVTAPDEEGKPITSRRSIALNYLRGWFWLDVISSIPFDLLVASDYRLVALLKVGFAG